MNSKKLKLIISMVAVLLLILLLSLLIYPKIEFKKDGKFYALRLTGDFSEFEQNASYNELYFYNEKNDISLKNFEVKNFLWYHLFSFDYVDGDFRQTQFKLEEEYIQNFLKNAVIEQNDANIDIAELIDGKTAVVGNTRYSGNEYENGIYYELDGKWDEMYVFESEGMTVIQVGSPDELPKYIAYK